MYELYGFALSAVCLPMLLLCMFRRLRASRLTPPLLPLQVKNLFVAIRYKHEQAAREERGRMQDAG
ncbi:hypothetical protein EON65_54600, partial [archaeon]